MIRLFALAAAIGLLTVFSLGCRTAHLGPSTGDAYRGAFAKQIEASESDADEAPGLSAEDAKQTMQVHTSSDGKPSDSASTAAPSITMGGAASNTSTAGGGKWPGASGNIQLEAK